MKYTKTLMNLDTSSMIRIESICFGITRECAFDIVTQNLNISYADTHANRHQTYDGYSALHTPCN